MNILHEINAKNLENVSVRILKFELRFAKAADRLVFYRIFSRIVFEILRVSNFF